MNPVISIRNLNHYYGSSVLKKQVLFDIQLDIQPGEIVIMTGPSGSGKTTLLTLLGGLRAVNNGSLVCLGQELSGATENTLVKVRRHIGYIFQAHNLLPFMTAQQNVCMSLEMHKGVNRQVAEQQANWVLQKVGLGDRINYYPDSLSGGQKQRVAIARALASQPKLVLADEPTASLDKKTGRDVVDLMAQLVKQQGGTILLVTHDNRILDIADRIIHMEDGHLVSSSPSPSVSVSSSTIPSPIPSPIVSSSDIPNPEHTQKQRQDIEEKPQDLKPESTQPLVLSNANQTLTKIGLPQYKNTQKDAGNTEALYAKEAVIKGTSIVESQPEMIAVPQSDLTSPNTNNLSISNSISNSISSSASNSIPNSISSSASNSIPNSISSSASNSIDANSKVYKVACIDDSSTVLRSVELFLDPKSFQTIPISDPVRALALILRHKPDLILLDIMMPHLDGYQLCSMLRKHRLFKKTPIVMATSRKGLIDKTKAKLCGASGYLVKPFNQADLMSKIFQYLV